MKTCDRPKCKRRASHVVRSTGSGTNPKPWGVLLCDVHTEPYTHGDTRPGVFVTVTPLNVEATS